ncbi:hypothetical protein EHW99_0359 [Erwinia amylovora]|uniref:Uncharacterized protein n=3 Tax=Erwinia amylovora TaxID=552 RepID=A0A830ZYD9_ERWAM|nr:hypothetical protein EaACW_3280 [Erwinia amylovora ACW56400]QJQ53066.1 hypothetical protein EHX00_0359 [Erwinia amylovora]CBA23320.1 hypothetical protein predicted by Glimmer/Critica [Erwinia amylovora CFBP1430]CBX82141.1 hypothetical protein predicted by Glimmer/Critica [Erwinia amylovora ATCC BAA-2158]CCO80119.1 hypothetical protein BN432_3349 [Erwinia amylovora Ea356]CCO83923.1 hypothetical protein BN433_3375 [Erwinia amylovora Ea266]CCO87685.1 hypothetical protein BN434_3325 [Erwinia a
MAALCHLSANGAPAANRGFDGSQIVQAFGDC